MNNATQKSPIYRDDAILISDPPLRQPLSPELQRAVQALSDTYERLDMRLETTLNAAENDFIAALDEVDGHEAELRQMVALLVRDLRHSASQAKSDQVLLRLTFQNQDDLTEQILSLLETQDNPL